MSFSKERAIIGQNAATAAASLLSGTGASYEEFEALRTAIAEGSLAFADGVIEGVTESAPRRSGGGGFRSSGGGGGQSNDSGAGVSLKFGKYQGKTIAEVYAADPEYVEWLSETSNNDFIKGKTAEFLASVN